MNESEMIEELTVIKEDLESMEESKLIERARIDREDPLSSVETNICTYVESLFNKTKRDCDFYNEIQEQLSSRLSSMTNNELLALHANTGSALNDRITSTLNPTMQIATARQQVLLAREQKEKEITITASSIKDVSATLPKDVLHGADALYNLLNEVMEKSKDIKEIDVTPKEEK